MKCNTAFIIFITCTVTAMLDNDVAAIVIFVFIITTITTKKLCKKAKKKGNEELSKWIQAVSHHLWWSAQTCNGDPELLQEKWLSILQHVVNKHKWRKATGKMFHKCAHGKLSRSKVRKTQSGSNLDHLLTLPWKKLSQIRSY